jgi:ParB family chromosome partitioning protein
MGHAKAILQTPAEQRRILRDQIIRRGLSVRASEELARRFASGTAARASRPGPSRDVHIVDLEDRLRRALRTKVKLVGRRNQGRIELHYFGQAELDRLADHLLGSST